MTTLSDFQIGDRVKHILRSEEGTVQNCAEDGLHVLFDNPTPRGNQSVGIYDRQWFDSHPDLLVNLTHKMTADDKRQSRSQWAQMGWHDRQQTPGA